MSGGEKIALDSLKEFRGADVSWFKEVFDAMMIVNCENDKDNEERYINEDEEKADCDGIAPSDSAPQSGMCEVKPNCYWSKAESGQPRGTEYSEDEAIEAKKLVEEYAISVGKYLAGPIVAGVLNFVFTIFYCCFRCICRLKCCGAR